MLHVVLHVCCMCVACVLHVRCMAGVQDRAVTLSKWRACHAERQPVHPTTLRNQVKKVSRLSLHVFHLAQPILAHMRPRKQTDTPTHKHLPKLIPMFFSHTVSSSFSRLSAAMGPSYCVFSESGFFKKNSHPQETTELPCLPPQPPTSVLWSEVPNIINRNGCFFWRPPNTQFRRQHWIGGRGGMTSAVWYFMGWLFFLKNPVRFFLVPSSF